MKFDKKLMAGIATAVLSLHAMPAMALGVIVTYENRISVAAIGQSSLEEATSAAMKLCAEHFGVECDAVTEPAVQAAMVLAKPLDVEGQMFYASDANPLEAAKKATRYCKVQYKQCGIAAAYWEPGPTWFAEAASETNYHIGVNGRTEEEAKNYVLKVCEDGMAEEHKGTCKILRTSSIRTWVAIARAEDSAINHTNFGKTEEEATKAALNSCGKKECKIVFLRLNRGKVPAPDSMKAVSEMKRKFQVFKRKKGQWID